MAAAHLREGNSTELFATKPPLAAVISYDKACYANMTARD